MLAAGCGLPLGLWLMGCVDDADHASPAAPVTGAASSWAMPAEDALHEATWMCFPGRRDVWGRDLPDVQDTIASIALTIAAYEPVRMLVRPEHRAAADELVGGEVELVEGPVDDLWARDTLPLFLVSDEGGLAAGRVRFNGWGEKQVHDGDARLAGVVAELLGIPLVDSGVVGEGGGVEADGEGTLLAARSSWVHPDRNPGRTDTEIAEALVDLLGAKRLLWVDGLAGHDITDGHIDTLARFADPGTIIHEVPSPSAARDVWYDLAVRTEAELGRFRTLAGRPYELVPLRQPDTTRRDDPEFLASYVNYYVCNGAVLVPEFGDASADAAAAELIAARHPGREVVALDIDPLAAGGGGIHCATQQQPAV